MEQYNESELTLKQRLEADRIALEQSKVDLEKTKNEQRTVVHVAWSIVAMIGVVIIPFVVAKTMIELELMK